jgi:hypothetical protein
MKKLILLVMIFFPQFAVHASGIVTIKGKLISMNSKEYEVESKNSVYTIDRAALTPDQVAAITRTEIPVRFQVPFEAVIRVKRNKIAQRGSSPNAVKQ